jgi:hypothetical protein
MCIFKVLPYGQIVVCVVKQKEEVMKKRVLLVCMLTVGLAAWSFARGGHGQGGVGGRGRGGGGGGQQSGRGQSDGSNLPSGELSEAQKEGLIFMYQEEKLARDVYNTLGDTWGSRIFQNIARAEQQHMNAVEGLLKKYSIPIPVSSSSTGVFADKNLQKLYNSLVEQGKRSEQDAYNVGVLIEETDINDLKSRMSGTPSDVHAVYSNLLRGSYNHLSAFNRTKSGGSGSGNGNGRGKGKGGGGQGQGSGSGSGGGGGHGQGQGSGGGGRHGRHWR